MESVGIGTLPPIGAFDLGTDPDTFHPSRDGRVLRERWGIGDAPLLITVARLVPHKGQDETIRAVASLAGEFPDLHYVMVGEGHDEERLKGLARELGVAEKIIFAGHLSESELPEAYATSTLYVGLSRIDREINAEGFGISFVEAGASGVPSVAGDSGGVRSAVRDGETGIVVPPRDPAALRSALERLLADPQLRRKLGAAGRDRARTHFSWEMVTDATLAAYAEALGTMEP